MATFLDLGLLQKFDMIFPFLLVLVVVWGFLSYSKFFGESKGGLHGLIALILAILVLLSEPARMVINNMAPWFIILVMFIFFLLLLAKTTGPELETGNYGWLIKIFLILSFVILIYSLIDVTMWDEDTDELGEAIEDGSVADTGKSGFYNTLRHPTMLGLMLIFLVAAFTIHKLSTEM